MVFYTQMDDMQPIDMRRRIRELLSIPDRDRTDAEWDELNELEIRTAPGNRDYDRSQDRQADRRPGTLIGQGRRPERSNGNSGRLQQDNRNPNSSFRQRPDGQPDGRLLKRQHRRPKRPGDGPFGMTRLDGGAAAEPTPIIVEIPSSGGKSEE